MGVAGQDDGSGGAAGLTTAGLFGLAALVGVGLVLPTAFVRVEEVAITPIVLLAALVLGLLARGRPLRGRVLLGLLGALFALRVVWIVVVNPALVSDFATYWGIANRWVESGVPYPLTDLYDRRAWPYLWPLAALFGKTHWSYQIANLVVIALASLATYLYADWRFGRLEAQVAVLFANLAPETFGAAGIATHDVAGLLFLSGVALTVLWLDRLTARGGRIPLLVLGSLLLAALTKLVEIQRLPATLVLASLFLAALAGPLTQARGSAIRRGDWRLLGYRVLFIAVLPALFLVAGTPAIDHVIGGPQTAAPSAVQEMAFLHDASKGTYEYKQEVVLEHMADVPSAELKRLARSLALSGWADNPGRRVRNLGRRSRILFDFGKSVAFYVASDSQKEARAEETYRWLEHGYLVVLCGMLAMLPLGLVSVARRGHGSADFPVTDWPLVFMAVFSLALLTVSEVQSRYLFPIYFMATPWCVAVVARILAALAGLSRGERRAARGLGRDALFMGAAVLSVWALWFGGGLALDAVYGPANGRIVNFLNGSTQPSGSMGWGETGSRSREQHEHADSFGPYDLWFAYATPNPREPAELRTRICDLDAGQSYEARLFLERTDMREGAESASHCRVGQPGSWRSCDLPDEHRLFPLSVPGLRADEAGCVELFVRLEPIEGEKVTEELWRIALLRLAPEARQARAAP